MNIVKIGEFFVRNGKGIALKTVGALALFTAMAFVTDQPEVEEADAVILDGENEADSAVEVESEIGEAE